MKQADFLSRLEAEASLQAKLMQNRVLPRQLDWFTALLGRYPWQTLLVVAGLAAVFLEVYG